MVTRTHKDANLYQISWDSPEYLQSNKHTSHNETPKTPLCEKFPNEAQWDWKSHPIIGLRLLYLPVHQMGYRTLEDHEILHHLSQML